VRVTRNRSILIIDDDPQMASMLRVLFERKGWQTTCAADAWAGLESYDRERPDLVLLDQDLPGLSGLRVLEVLRERDRDATVLMLTGHGDIPLAVEAMRLGAENFLSKPVDPAHLDAAVRLAAEKAELRRQNRFFRERQAADAGLGALGSSEIMRDVAWKLELLAAGTAPVLLTGETGTGKSWAAKRLHTLSARAGRPFVEINCAGLTSTFLDSELFGHERGAFTDAKTQKPGLFEIADGGTLLLDEIGDLAPELQPKLLTVLESQRFRRLGGTREIEVDVRLVAATHHDLKAAVDAGRFRQDLYFRLAVFPLRMPALRERGRDDVLALAQQLLVELQRRLGRGPTRFSVEALATLARHPWPGNIRELRNTIERILLFAQKEEELRPEHLPAELAAAGGVLRPDDFQDGDFTLATAERRHIERVVAHFGNHRSRAARALGISRATLYKKLRVS
jgi:DNA-binding NtrC family response regulator